jgi:hypothetical protein
METVRNEGLIGIVRNKPSQNNHGREAGKLGSRGEERGSRQPVQRC